MFSFLEVMSGFLNLVTSLLGNNPTWDLDGSFLKRRLDSIYRDRVQVTAEDRVKAENAYKGSIKRLKQSV